LELLAIYWRVGAKDGRRQQRVVARHVHLEVLEHPARLGGLLARVADQHVSALSDALQTIKEGGVEGERHQARGGLKGPQGAIAAIVGPLPHPFQLIARGLPLVKLSLPDLPPTFKTCHVDLRPYLTLSFSSISISNSDTIVNRLYIPIWIYQCGWQ